MKNTVRLLVVSLLAFLWASSVNLWAQGEMEGHLIVTGVVKDKQNKKPLENVNVSLFGSHIGTVTNADGLFTLKIRKEETAPVLELSHIGYQNVRVSPEGNRKSEIVVWMVPDRKSTRLNSSHANISYAVFCLKKKKTWHADSRARRQRS